MDIVDTVVVNPYGEILMVVRGKGTRQPGYIGFPGGKVDEGEPAIVAASRELAEETGLRCRSPRPIASFDLTAYYRTDPVKYWVGSKCRTLHVFSASALHSDRPVNLEPHKHDELIWLTPAQILATEKKLTLVDEVIRRFTR